MQKIKLHLGCGKQYIKGFIHIDLSEFSHIDYRHDIKTLPMFQDESVDLIYSSHTIEYFDRIEVKRVLSEWHRVLKYGGILRLAVPDFEALIGVYSKYKELDQILGPLYGRMEIKGNPYLIYHKTTYDYKTLEKVLREAGFVKIMRYDWRCTIHKDYDDFSQAYIPHMDKENGVLISLNVECEKLDGIGAG